MKAMVLEKVGELKIKEIDKPVPKSNEVLVKIKACGLCGTDIKLYKGEYTAKVPVILGHEFSGEVTEVGKDVRNFKIGDRVIVDPNESCGICEYCRNSKPTFCNNLSAYGVLRDGGFAEYCVIGEKGTYRIPDNLSFEEASFTEAISCALHAVDRADIKLGESVLIIGGGIQGQILIQLCKLQGASSITMITRSKEKQELAKEFGAGDCPSFSEEGLSQFFRRKNGTVPLEQSDIVIEAVGTPETVEFAISLAKRGGKVIIFGFTPEGKKANFMPFDVLYKELTIMGSWVNPYTFDRALSLLSTGKVDVKPLITKEIKLENIMEGIELMINKPKGFLKAIIKP